MDWERRFLMSALHWIIIGLVCGVVEILTADSGFCGCAGWIIDGFVR
jgi:membrane protein implicated in regulation of membrane protease activity